MTKEKLFEIAENEFHSSTKHPLYKCHADWAITALPTFTGYYITLRSYRTIVATYSTELKALYVRDYYSATTSQHVHKFIRLLYGHFGETTIYVYYLYRRSDAVVLQMYSQLSTGTRKCMGLIATDKLSTKDFNIIANNDFEILINPITKNTESEGAENA